MPFGNGRQYLNNKGALAWIAGGWEVDGVFAAYTGTPFTVTAPNGASINAPGNLQTANQVAPVVNLGGIGPGTNYYDPRSFAAPVGVVFGNTGRNTLRRPGIVNTDLSIVKNFAIRERFKASFRAEMFNAFNHPQWGGNQAGSAMASTDVTNPNFLRILSAFNERQIRFGLRLGF